MQVPAVIFPSGFLYIVDVLKTESIKTVKEVEERKQRVIIYGSGLGVHCTEIADIFTILPPLLWFCIVDASLIGGRKPRKLCSIL